MSGGLFSLAQQSLDAYALEVRHSQIELCSFPANYLVFILVSCVCDGSRHEMREGVRVFFLDQLK